MRALLVIALAALLGASSCVRSFGVGTDGSSSDRPPASDRRTELAKGDLAKGDLADLAQTPDLRRDQPKPADAKPGSEASVCVEATTIKTGVPCAQQCTSAANDTDCDGIPNARDPSATCNPLLSFEHLTSVSPSTKWFSSGPVSWPCGTASLGLNGKLTLGQGELGTIPSGKFIVEAKYTLGASVVGDWGVYLQFSKPGDPATWFSCEQWVNATNGGKGSVHLTGNWCTGFGTWAITEVDVTPGKTFYLQLYSDGALVSCRVATDGDTIDLRSSACPVSAPGSLYLLATRPITVDQIRIFQY